MDHVVRNKTYLRLLGLAGGVHSTACHSLFMYFQRKYRHSVGAVLRISAGPRPDRFFFFFCQGESFAQYSLADKSVNCSLSCIQMSNPIIIPNYSKVLR